LEQESAHPRAPIEIEIEVEIQDDVNPGCWD
jgi:hypothetical protein